MKKSFPITLACAAMLLSCNGKIDVAVEAEQPLQEVKTYTLTVEAGKGERPDTKALVFDELAGELEAKWAVGEEVAVYKGETQVGTLTAQTAGHSTTLTGDITGAIQLYDVLTLKFLGPDYASQEGTLQYIAEHCDYATASVVVTAISGEAVATTAANFQNQQAIVKFTLRNSDNTANLNANSLIITLSDQTIIVAPESATNVFYVAVPALSSKALSLNASVESTLYELNKDAISLAAGQYYSITARLTATTSVYYIERSWDDVNKVVKETVRILESGQYTELNGSGNIDFEDGCYYVVKGNVSCSRITATGSMCHLILCDGARLEPSWIWVEAPNGISIYGQAGDSGKLLIEVSSVTNGYYAGIGGGYCQKSGTINIHGGDIHAEGHQGGAGIGGGCLDVEGSHDGNATGDCGTVTIYGGKVYALGGGYNQFGAAGIGGGNAGSGGTITIYGGEIEAHGSTINGGAGIGGGNCRDYYSRHPGGTITIHGGDVEAHGGEESAGIGGAWDGHGANVTINGGTVTARGNKYGAGIGTGYKKSSADMSAGSLTVNGGEVYAYGGNSQANLGGGAGIGGGKDSHGSSVTINGGYVYAKGGEFSAGIGSGCEALLSEGVRGGTFTVTGGDVYAYGGEDSAGIGGGEDADGATVVISGGYVYAEGDDKGAGIGGGESGYGGSVTITGGTVIAKTTGTQDDSRAIGAGSGDSHNGSFTLGDPMMVRPAYGEGWFAPVAAAQRVNTCRNYSGVWVRVCNHPDHTPQNCPYCVH
jgi:hypothetical protein